MNDLCCGKNRDSRFCPDCGNKLTTGHEGLPGLLSHCQLHCRRISEEIKKLKLLTEEQRIRRRTRPNAIQNSERTLLKWTSWVVELKKVIDEQDAGRGEE